MNKGNLAMLRIRSLASKGTGVCSRVPRDRLSQHGHTADRVSEGHKFLLARGVCLENVSRDVCSWAELQDAGCGPSLAIQP